MPEMPSQDPILTIKALYKAFDGELIIKNFDLDLYPQERLMLFAASGTGKTTLLRIIQGLIKPDSGSFSFSKGISPTLVFQEPRLFPSLTLFENILLPFATDFTIKDRIGTLSEWLSLTGLEEAKDKYPKELSGGMKRKTSLLRALISSPKLLVMDEPFQSLDMGSKQVFTEKIIPSLPETSILFTSHDLSDVELFASSVFHVRGNKLSNGKRYSPTEFLNALPLLNSVKNRNLNFGKLRGEI